MSKDARALMAIIFGGVAFPALAYWLFGDYLAWWFVVIPALGVAGAVYGGLTDQKASERMADGGY